MSRNVAAHVRITDRDASRATSITAVLERARQVLYVHGIDLTLEVAYDLDSPKGRALHNEPGLTGLRAEAAGAKKVKAPAGHPLAGKRPG